jgi:GGDEF domain-containing protein
MIGYHGRYESGMDADEISRFREVALLELKRAERYRNFLSLLVLNLSEFLSTVGRRRISSREEADQFMVTLVNRIKERARETDMVSGLNNAHLVMLLPETDGSGAEVAARRFQELLADYLCGFMDSDYQFHVPLEITSFPDGAGKKVFQTRLMSLLAAS